MTVRILVGDALAMLKTLPDESVQTCVTSPPYWGLRDYGVVGQLGLERTPDEYATAMVGVFAEVRRVMRDDGTLWLNIGDSYARGFGGGTPGEKSATNRGSYEGRQLPTHLTEGSSDGVVGRGDRPGRLAAAGLKSKDLVGVPWLLAFALRADGWFLRQEIIWHKSNPMPESVTDRPTRAHEQIFLFSKSARYYYDADAITEPTSENTHARLSQDVAAQVGSARANGGTRADRPMKAVGRKRQVAGEGIKANDDFHDKTALLVDRRNKRTVWKVPTEAFRGAHFATFPTKLIEPCILAGSAAGGTVLDPFGGAGTTGLVADRLGRHAILCELNPEYAAMAERRIRDASPLLTEVHVA